MSSRDPQRGRLPLRGPGDPLPPPGGVASPRREPRGPGARGWCKTPAPKGPGGPKKPENTPKWGIMAKKAIFGPFCWKWPFLATFQENPPVATGAKTPILAKKGQNPGKGVKIPDSRDLAVAARGVLHQPLAPGPRGSGGGWSGPLPGRGWPRAPRRSPGEVSRDPGTPGPPPGTAGPRREGLM